MSLSLDRRLEIFAPRDDLFRRSNVHLYDVDYVKDFYHVDYELPEVRSDRFAPALPVEIWQKIVKDYKYQRADYAALCRSSSQLKAFAAPELYSVIGLRLCSAATKQSDENDKKGLPFPEMFPLVRELTLVSERAPAISYGRLLLSKFTSLRGLRFDKATFLEMFAGQELNGLQQWRALTVRSLVLDGDCGLLELQRLLQIPTLKDLKLQSCSLRLGTTQADRRAVSKSHLEGTSNVQVLHLGHWMVGPDYRVILRIPRRLTHFSAIVYKTSDWDAQSQQISTILGSQKSSLTYISLAHESHRNGLFEILGNLHNFVALRCLELDDWKHTRPSFLAPPRPSELSQLMLPAELETLKLFTSFGGHGGIPQSFWLNGLAKAKKAGELSLVRLILQEHATGRDHTKACSDSPNWKRCHQLALPRDELGQQTWLWPGVRRFKQVGVDVEMIDLQHQCHVARMPSQKAYMLHYLWGSRYCPPRVSSDYV